MIAAKEVLTWPDERLRQVCAPVTEFGDALRSFVADMEAVMRSGPAAVGIAAPQVGCLRRVVIVDASARKGRNHGRLVLVNPEIVSWDGSVKGREGCLSVPDMTGNVVRAQNIAIECVDEYGRPQSYEMSHFEARVVQHELDHLDGLLFLDRVVSRRSDLFKRSPEAK